MLFVVVVVAVFYVNALAIGYNVRACARACARSMKLDRMIIIIVVVVVILRVAECVCWQRAVATYFLSGAFVFAARPLARPFVRLPDDQQACLPL